MAAMLRVLLSVASLALLATAQTEERVVAVRSLQPFLQPSLQSGQAMDSALPAEERSVGRDATLRGRGKAETAWLIALLKERHKKNLEDGQLILAVDENARVALHGTKGAVNSCLADIDSIAGTLTRSIEISVYQLAAFNGELPPAFIDGKTLQATLATTPPLWSARAVTRPGGSVKLGDVRWTTYVRDHDSEVAEDSKTFDPKVDHFFRGTRVALTVHALPSDELLLHGSWLTSDSIELAQVTIGKGQPFVGLPFNRTAHISFGGKVNNGDGLVVAARRESKQGMSFVYAVRARYLSPPPQRANNLFVFPATAWTASTRTGWPMRAAWFVEVNDDDNHPLISEMPVLSPANLATFLAPQAEGTVLMAGSTLIINDNAAVCARAETALRQLVDAQLRHAELRITQTSKHDHVPTNIVQPVLANMQAEAFIGTERAVVGDHEVEIAQETNINNPIVKVVRSGVWSRLTGHAMARNWNIEGLWRSAQQLPARYRVQSSKPPVNMQLPDYKSSAWPWDGPIPLNTVQELAPHFSVQVKAQ
ncbi:MAG: hypothetical protein ACI91B_003829 [Planctomycetota bacterium]|jgi:hypothetical protein